jgi:hypothetical protein
MNSKLWASFNSFAEFGGRLVAASNSSCFEARARCWEGVNGRFI